MTQLLRLTCCSQQLIYLSTRCRRFHPFLASFQSLTNLWWMARFKRANRQHPMCMNSVCPVYTWICTNSCSFNHIFFSPRKTHQTRVYRYITTNLPGRLERKTQAWADRVERVRQTKKKRDHFSVICYSRFSIYKALFTCLLDDVSLRCIIFILRIL